MRNALLGLLLVSALIVRACVGFRVLGLFPLPIKSHFIVFETLMKELVDRGHEVHVVNHFPQKQTVPGYHDIDITGSVASLVNNISVGSRIGRGVWDSATYLYQTCGSDICGHIFNHPAMVELKESTLKFDLIIAEVYGTDCLLGFAHLFKSPIIGISSTHYLPWVGDRMGNPDNPSYLPNYFLPTSGKVFLFEKLQMVAATLLTKLGYFFISTIPSEMRAREFFGANFPPLDNLAFNTSIMFVNVHISINEARPMVPGVVEIGGLHIGQPGPLTSKYKRIFDSAEAGIIYFSMGTVINMETYPPEQLNPIMNAFSKLPHKVIWSVATTNLTVAVPKNVHIFTWTPQLDILCNDKTKVFVTQGGLMSVQEAAYCGVPILSIPLFPDQKLNSHQYVKGGAGLMIEYEDISVENVEGALRDLINNSSFKTNAQFMSRLFRDRPMTALDTAIYWIEYVVRHKGAPHLRTKGADLIWFEYYLIDILILVIGMLFLFITFFIVFLELLQNYFDKRTWHVSKVKQK